MLIHLKIGFPFSPERSIPFQIHLYPMFQEFLETVDKHLNMKPYLSIINIIIVILIISILNISE